ncbi:PREDICTED: EGF-like repeat and discoidin I-like domain-containing protein 3, partial [Acropora digitifera]|uniref:EGF-like repeat and discoidin I-like domain-containing protein 3 n=1 Tax=Acropora digitifera TaxID=70779 RepID=UPI00077B1EEF
MAFRFLLEGLIWIVITHGVFADGGLVAHFPLNGTYGTKEINNWVPEAVASDVTFAKGPNGHSQGSYQFNGSSNSYILFSNYNGGPLDVRHAISITCWLYYDGQDGPIFSYGRSNWGVDFWVLEKKLYFRLVTRQGSQQIEALDAMTQASKWTFVGASYDSSSGDARLWSQGFFQTLNVGIFHKKGDSETVDQHTLPMPLEARYVRFHPVRQVTWNCMRVEAYKNCPVALGMQTGAILDKQINASSEQDGKHAAIYGRKDFQISTNISGSWVSKINDAQQWLQIDLLNYFTKITAVSTQGGHSIGGSQHWIKKYKLQYSDTLTKFQFYKTQGQSQVKMFMGNMNPNDSVLHQLNPPVRARYIRFLPKEWEERISMRVELYGCKECADARGMQNSIISDAQLSASSSFNLNEAANQGRLHNDYTSLYAGAWVAATTFNEWIQIDLLSNYTRISRVATQGRHHVDNITYQWVKKYNLKYSDFENDTTFRFYMEEGQIREKTFNANTGKDTVVYQKLNPPIRARYIRFYPTEWKQWVAMRVELYGCK